jgi:plastocyanin
MNKKTLILIIIGVLVLVGIGVWIYASNQKTTSSTAPGPNGQPSATITYSNSGFSPKTVTVSTGAIIAIRNTSSSDMQFDSDPHPVHTDDTELNVGTVAPGKTVTFKVSTPGTHGYHNHLNPGDTGTIIVQ